MEVISFTLGLSLALLPIENKRGRVYAKAQASRFGAIVEDMTEMGFAFATEHFGTFYAMLGIQPSDDTIRQWLPETGPAAARFILHFRVKQRVVAAHATIHATVMAIPILACEWCFCTTLPTYAELLGGEFGAPFICRFLDLIRHYTSFKIG